MAVYNNRPRSYNDPYARQEELKRQRMAGANQFAANRASGLTSGGQQLGGANFRNSMTNPAQSAVEPYQKPSLMTSAPPPQGGPGYNGTRAEVANKPTLSGGNPGGPRPNPYNQGFNPPPGASDPRWAALAASGVYNQPPAQNYGPANYAAGNPQFYGGGGGAQQTRQPYQPRAAVMGAATDGGGQGSPAPGYQQGRTGGVIAGTDGPYAPQIGPAEAANIQRWSQGAGRPPGTSMFGGQYVHSGNNWRGY